MVPRKTEDAKKKAYEKLTELIAAKSFEQLLLEAIDDVFFSLGTSVKVSLYFHLENQFNIEKQTIPEGLDDFSDALERIFGIGARSLELLFMERLHSKLKFVCSWPGCKRATPEVTFVEYAHLMKQEFEEASKGEKRLEVFVDAGEKQKQII